MSTDTKGIINKKVSSEEVYNFIYTKIDSSAEFNKDDFGGRIAVDRIYFQNRTMSIICDHDSERNEYKGLDFTDDDKNYVWLSLGYRGDSIDIMKKIINHFGGYVDENDCDDEGFYYIPTNPEQDVPMVIRATMKDVYEKFGGVVIIKDK